MVCLLEELSEKRGLFFSEADFQFSLAWFIKEKHEEYEVLLEYPFDICEKDKEGNDKANTIYLDIILKKEDKFIPIELKYKTKEFCYENYNLKNHSAKNQACYDFLKDIQRIEYFKEKNKDSFESGYAIFLTNDMGFTKEPRNDAGYKEFSIHNGETKIGELDWSPTISEGTKKGRKNSINLKNKYELEWNLYSNFEEVEKNSEFKYLLVKI